jgi:hypothetical protein
VRVRSPECGVRGAVAGGGGRFRLDSRCEGLKKGKGLTRSNAVGGWRSAAVGGGSTLSTGSRSKVETLESKELRVLVRRGIQVDRLALLEKLGGTRTDQPPFPQKTHHRTTALTHLTIPSSTSTHRLPPTRSRITRRLNPTRLSLSDRNRLRLSNRLRDGLSNRLRSSLALPSAWTGVACWFGSCGGGDGLGDGDGLGGGVAFPAACCAWWGRCVEEGGAMMTVWCDDDVDVEFAVDGGWWMTKPNKS